MEERSNVPPSFSPDSFRKRIGGSHDDISTDVLMRISCTQNVLLEYSHHLNQIAVGKKCLGAYRDKTMLRRMKGGHRDHLHSVDKEQQEYLGHAHRYFLLPNF